MFENIFIKWSVKIFYGVFNRLEPGRQGNLEQSGLITAVIAKGGALHNTFSAIRFLQRTIQVQGGQGLKQPVTGPGLGQLGGPDEARRGGRRQGGEVDRGEERLGQQVEAAGQ